MENKSKKKQKSWSHILFVSGIIFFISFFIIFFINSRLLDPIEPSQFSRKRMCFSNIRVLNGAVEMYNMDNLTMIKELNNNNIKTLVDLRYLREEPIPPMDQKCIYTSKGDISKDGLIYCVYHGSLDQSIKGNEDPSDFEYEKDIARKKNLERILIIIALGLFPVITYIIFALI